MKAIFLLQMARITRLAAGTAMLVLALANCAPAGAPDSGLADGRPPAAGSAEPVLSETAPVGSAPEDASTSAAQSPIEAVQADAPDLGAAIRKGMSYGELSKSLASAGWQPVIDDACMLNMVGKDYAAHCADNPDEETCAWCRDVAGLRQCSADGFCLLWFRDAAGRTLQVGMDGELDNWKRDGADTMFGVGGWRLVTP